MQLQIAWLGESFARALASGDDFDPTLPGA
jgi:hypothetical protein